MHLKSSFRNKNDMHPWFSNLPFNMSLKISSCWNTTPWRCTMSTGVKHHTFSTLTLEVSGHLHVPAVFTQWKDHLVPFH